MLRVDRMPVWEDPRGLLDFTLADGGPAGTACFVASTFGLRTGFVDTVGDDDLGEHRRRSLEKAGVDTSRLVPREGPEDHVVVVYVDAATGERVFSFRRGFLSRPVDASELDRAYIESARILHLDGSHGAAALAAARWMKEAGGTVVLDAAATSHEVLEPARALVAETDVLICGSGFAPMLTGEEDVWRAGRAALDLGPRVVVQTEGAAGQLHGVPRRRVPHTRVRSRRRRHDGRRRHVSRRLPGGPGQGLGSRALRRVLVGGRGPALHRARQPQGDPVDGRGRGADGGPAGRQGGGRGDGAVRVQGEKRMGRIGITFNYWGNEWMEDIEEYERRMARAAAIGFDLMSFSQDVLFLYTAEQKKRFVASAAEHGIRVNYMAGLGPKQDINSDSEEDRRRGIAHLRALAETASEMQEMAGGGGADVGGAITGVMRQGLDGRDKERCWAHAVGAMREAMKTAEDLGVTFHIEVLNRFEHFLINTCDEALRFLDDVGSPNLKMMLDTYHMNIEEDSLGEAIVRAGDQLGTFHIGENNRRPPGRGHIPWDEVVAALHEIGYDRDTVMEPIVHMGGGVGNLLGVWRDMTDNRDLDEAAREGLEFYRSKLAVAQTGCAGVPAGIRREAPASGNGGRA